MPKLLVIDDQSSIRFSIEQVFDSAGVQVLGASSAEEGLRIAGREHPDAILLDLSLGPSNGLDLFKPLHAINPAMPVIVITGLGGADNFSAAKKLGAFEFLVKPLDLAKLKKVVMTAFAKSRPH